MAVDAMTATQLADVRADLADTAASPRFDDAALARLWERAGGKHYGTCLLAARILMREAVRFHDYMIGQGATDQKKSQLFKQAQAMVDDFAKLAARERFGGSGLASLQLGTANTVLDPYDTDDEADDE